jgi:hypothetical protein
MVSGCRRGTLLDDIGGLGNRNGVLAGYHVGEGFVLGMGAWERGSVGEMGKVWLSNVLLKVHFAMAFCRMSKAISTP